MTTKISPGLGEKKVKKKLTLKQKKFTVEYIKTGNGTKAAIKAGYSKKSAQEIASENLSKPIIQEEIQSAAAKLGIDAEYVLKNFKDIADFNKKKVFKIKNINGEVFNEKEMIDANASIRASEMLGKHLKLFTDKIELDAKVDQTIDDKTKKTQIAKKIAMILLNPELSGELDNI